MPRLAAMSVAGVAQLYLGNILYALELAAISLDEQKKDTDAAFYRGIAERARGNEPQAKRRFGEALATDPSFKPALIAQMG